MSGDGPSELPQHYGSRTTDGELIRRPVTPPVLASPRRPYNPNPRAFSPERTPVDAHHYSDSEVPRTSGGLRRRPSGSVNAPPSRRWSGGEYDRERPIFSTENNSRKALRSRDDSYYREDDFDRYYPPRAHPDQYERSRPPRAYRNVDGWEKGPSSASKPFFDESRSDYNRDLEKGEDQSWRKKSGISAEESVDGYDYERNKRNLQSIDFKNLTPEERAEVMRLPWTQWMNSNVKNRMFTAQLYLTSLTDNQILWPLLESSLGLPCSFSLLSLALK